MKAEQILKLSDAITAMEEEITKLNLDLERYKGQAKPSKNLIYYKTQQVLILTSCLNEFQAAEEELKNSLIENDKKIGQLENKIWKLEGVCLLHGIHDINDYLSKKPHEITDMVLEAWAEGWRQTPVAILYKDEKKEPVKYANKPVVDFTQLFQGSINNRNNF